MMLTAARILLQAIATVVGVVGTLAYMYTAGKQTKREEGPASIYRAVPKPLLTRARLLTHAEM